jgi:hypothetical protein
MRGDPFERGLASVEAVLYDLITAPEGVGRRLGELGRSAADLEAIVKPSLRMSAVERLDVYANMYFYRILDVLRGEYPKLLLVLGDAAFHNLVTDYLVARRPAHPSLREAGARLPEFVATHALAGGRAWITDLARLERTHLELYDGPDADTLTRDAVASQPPESVPALVLRAIPSHAVLGSRFAVSEIWNTLAAGEAPLTFAERRETLIVWREGIDVRHRSVDADEEPLLPLIRDGARFDAVCDVLLERVPPDIAPARAFQIVGRWIADGLLAANR